MIDGDEGGGGLRRSIYVIHSTVGAVKVGIAIDPIRRLGGLQGGSPLSPESLSLAFVGETEYRAAAAIEARAHEILGPFRLHREWFKTSSTVAIEAIRSAALELGHELQEMVVTSPLVPAPAPTSNAIFDLSRDTAARRARRPRLVPSSETPRRSGSED